jgi:hypothetical protein
MNAAIEKNPPGAAGYKKEAIYHKNNISQNLHVINSTIVKTRLSLHLSIDEWRNFSVFCARLALDSAPDEVRQLFLGKPSTTSKNAVFLAEVFTTLVVQAEDAAEATGTQYSYEALWNEAIALWEVSK